jgi:hypothetical protein
VLPPGRRFYGWWYASIGTGFVLLGINRLVQGDRSWVVLLRFLIAAGFGVLGWSELRRR